MDIFNEWLVFSLATLAVWFIIFIFRKGLRKEMLWASILTAPLGLSEILFVPEYWNPPSLFDLNLRTSFDIESIIWAFAVGGIASVLYEIVFRSNHKKINKHEMGKSRHRWHLLALTSPIFFYLVLQAFTGINTIYSGSIAMFFGGIAIILCRPDLRKKMLVGGILFLALYFTGFFLFFNFIYTDAVRQIWNLSAISGILIFGIPIEELLFAFTFGMMWSGIYEHVKWYKLK